MRSKPAFRLFAATVLACMTVGTERLAACTCIQSGPACQETWRAGAVFVGRVVEIVPQAEQRQIGSSTIASTVFRVRLQATERFRGDLKETVDLFTETSSSACGYEFVQGRSYLIYAHWQQTLSRWSTSICSRTRPVEDAREDLAYLRGPATQPSGLGMLQGTATREDPDPAHEYREFWRKPYANARIIVESVGTKATARYETRTGPDGRYSIAVPAGKYSVTPILPATLYNWPLRPVDVLDVRGCADASFAVRSDGRIAGRIVDTSGAPVAHLSVEALELRAAAQPYYGSNMRAITDATGKFEFTRLPPDTYRLGFDLRKEPRADSNAAWLTDEPEGPPVEIAISLEQQIWTRDFVLPKAVVIAPVSGVVVDAADKPVDRARVYLISATGYSILGEALTNAAGEFRLGTRLGMDYRLVAEHYIAPRPGRSAELKFRAAFELPPFKLKFER